MPRECLADTVLEGLVAEPAMEAPELVIKNATTHPEASLEERFKAIDLHIARRHTVCPLGVSAARKKDIYYWGLPAGQAEDPRSSSKFLKRALDDFLRSGKRVMILAFGDNFDDHVGARQAGKMLFCEFAVGSVQNAYGGRFSQIQVQDAVYKRFGSMIGDPNRTIREPLVEFRNGRNATPSDVFFVFMSNDLYHEEHPRYLPYPALVITYNEDLVRVMHEDMALAGRISVNAMTGIASPHIDGLSLADLRRGSSVETVNDPTTGRVIGHIPQLHPAISKRLEIAMAMIYKKGFYVMPIPEGL